MILLSSVFLVSCGEHDAPPSMPPTHVAPQRIAPTQEPTQLHPAPQKSAPVTKGIDSDLNEIESTVETINKKLGETRK
jgi:hypothetical protein